MNRCWAACGLMLLGCGSVAGCGAESKPSVSVAADTSAPANRVGKAAKTAAPPSAPAASRETVSPDAFASVDEAVEALTRAAEQRDSQQRLRASDWLAMQGAAAIPRLAGVLRDETAGTASRIAACRVLGRLGPPALEVLVEQLDADDQMVRINALDQLPHIKPSVPRVIETLVATLDHEDERMRQRAVKGLGRLGTQARSAAPRLQEILNSKASDQLRNDAKDALRRVDPRRTLTFD